eukprot:jgi/Mesen1/6673/ME000343S05843
MPSLALTPAAFPLQVGIHSTSRLGLAPRPEDDGEVIERVREDVNKSDNAASSRTPCGGRRGERRLQVTAMCVDQVGMRPSGEAIPSLQAVQEGQGGGSDNKAEKRGGGMSAAPRLLPKVSGQNRPLLPKVPLSMGCGAPLFREHVLPYRPAAPAKTAAVVLADDAAGGSPSNGSKKRIRWTKELRELFRRAVRDLGGLDKATPKKVLRSMDWSGLSLYQVKSYLQKFRLTQHMDQEGSLTGSSSDDDDIDSAKDSDTENVRKAEGVNRGGAKAASSSCKAGKRAKWSPAVVQPEEEAEAEGEEVGEDTTLAMQRHLEVMQDVQSLLEEQCLMQAKIEEQHRNLLSLLAQSEAIGSAASGATAPVVSAVTAAFAATESSEVQPSMAMVPGRDPPRLSAGTSAPSTISPASLSAAVSSETGGVYPAAGGQGSIQELTGDARSLARSDVAGVAHSPCLSGSSPGPGPGLAPPLASGGGGSPCNPSPSSGEFPGAQRWGLAATELRRMEEKERRLQHPDVRRRQRQHFACPPPAAVSSPQQQQQQQNLAAAASNSPGGRGLAVGSPSGLLPSSYRQREQQQQQAAFLASPCGARPAALPGSGSSAWRPCIVPAHGGGQPYRGLQVDDEDEEDGGEDIQVLTHPPFLAHHQGCPLPQPLERGPLPLASTCGGPVIGQQQGRQGGEEEEAAALYSEDVPNNQYYLQHDDGSFSMADLDSIMLGTGHSDHLGKGDSSAQGWGEQQGQGQGQEQEEQGSSEHGAMNFPEALVREKAMELESMLRPSSSSPHLPGYAGHHDDAIDSGLQQPARGEALRSQVPARRSLLAPSLGHLQQHQHQHQHGDGGFASLVQCNPSSTPGHPAGQFLAAGSANHLVLPQQQQQMHHVFRASEGLSANNSPLLLLDPWGGATGACVESSHSQLLQSVLPSGGAGVGVPFMQEQQQQQQQQRAYGAPAHCVPHAGLPDPGGSQAPAVMVNGDNSSSSHMIAQLHGVLNSTPESPLLPLQLLQYQETLLVQAQMMQEAGMEHAQSQALLQLLKSSLAAIGALVSNASASPQGCPAGMQSQILRQVELILSSGGLTDLLPHGGVLGQLLGAPPDVAGKACIRAGSGAGAGERHSQRHMQGGRGGRDSGAIPLAGPISMASSSSSSGSMAEYQEADSGLLVGAARLTGAAPVPGMFMPESGSLSMPVPVPVPQLETGATLMPSSPPFRMGEEVLARDVYSALQVVTQECQQLLMPLSSARWD